MMTATATRADAGSLAIGSERPFVSWTARLQAHWNKHRAFRKTLAELQALTDRQLVDVGTTRTGLRLFARRALYGN